MTKNRTRRARSVKIAEIPNQEPLRTLCVRKRLTAPKIPCDDRCCCSEHRANQKSIKDPRAPKVDSLHMFSATCRERNKLFGSFGLLESKPDQTITADALSGSNWNVSGLRPLGVSNADQTLLNRKPDYL